MARVLPSDVVRLINDQFYWVKRGSWPSEIDDELGASLAGLVSVAEQIPEALLPVSSDKRIAFIFSISSIRHLVDGMSRGASFAGTGLPWPTVNGTNVVTRLWQLLRECPDEAISEAAAGLEFIQNDDFRRGLRIDLSSVESALSNGEWKGATVLAGSVLEALLLSAVRTHPVDGIAVAAEKTSAAGRLSRTPNASHPERWDLIDLIEVALELKMIGETTASQARIAKDFRNLIHPGRELRLQMRCDRGSARSAAAAVDLAIRDLSERLNPTSA